MPDHCLKERLALACRWLTDVAQVTDAADITDDHRRRHRHQHWTGAIRGEYRASERKWSFFCPVWHTGQAVKALVMASHHLGDHLLQPAIAGADFILANQLTKGPDAGLILAWEDHPDKVNTSAILEGLDGLFMLSDATGDKRYRDAALAALTWIADHAWIQGEGLLRDLYDVDNRRFIERGYLVTGRPLLDDGIFLRGFEENGEPRFRTLALEIAERLLVDEDPDGNWVTYPPCNLYKEMLHPRHAFWWGRPMLKVFDHTGDKRFLDLFKRSVNWYVNAMTLDGAIMRGTRRDFKTDSFGHATSGTAGALLMFVEAATKAYDNTLAEPIQRALAFCLRMQFTKAQDPNLQGAILEKVLPPDGSDASPYYLRDLGTIFFIQAASDYLHAVDKGKLPPA